MKRLIPLALTISTLAACGGGGGGSGNASLGNGSSGAQPAPAPTPAAPSIPAIDVRQAFSTFIQTDRSVSLASNDGSLATATLSIGSDESYPFITNGQAQAVHRTRVVSLLYLDASGRLVRRTQWKFHLDADLLPVGLAFGRDDSGFKECMSVEGRAALPASSNAGGVFLNGQSTANYAETYRSGTYAHYCDPGSAYPEKVEWSVQAGAPDPYFCLTLPNGFASTRSRICAPVDGIGKQGASLWVRTYATDGSIQVDYKDSAGNRPVEQFPTTVNPNNYWYGAVWRPLDGHIYERYESTRFSSRQACRDQTAIDWKKTYSASNIAWTCINVMSS